MRCRTGSLRRLYKGKSLHRVATSSYSQSCLAHNLHGFHRSSTRIHGSTRESTLYSLVGIQVHSGLVRATLVAQLNLGQVEPGPTYLTHSLSNELLCWQPFLWRVRHGFRVAHLLAPIAARC